MAALIGATSMSWKAEANAAVKSSARRAVAIMCVALLWVGG